MYIIVSNLSNDISEEELKNLFSEFSEVKQIKIISRH
jgi:RNA recognition motif-containing protein